MKFQTLETFNRHLEASASRELDSVFLLIFSSEEERQVEMHKVCSLIEHKNPSMRVVSFSGLESTVESIQMELNSLSLWDEVTVIFCDHFDKVKNNQRLASICLNLNPYRYLILGSSSFKGVSDFYQQGKKNILVLDLSDEKPWEKQRRIQTWIKEECHKQSKIFQPQALAYLMEIVELDRCLLQQELNKLLCYVGEKKQIELEDVKAICCPSFHLTSWQLAEKVIWERPVNFSKQHLELGFIFSLIGQLRYQLQVGCQMAELIKKQALSQNLAHHFPQLRPTQLQKYQQAVIKKPLSFFREGLNFLYEIELQLKSSNLEPRFLMDLFQAKLYGKTDSSSQYSSRK